MIAHSNCIVIRLPDKRCLSHGMCLYQVVTLHFLNGVVDTNRKIDNCVIIASLNSESACRGTKVEKMLTLAPDRYTAGFCMVAKVIQWCIRNHCIADSIDLYNTRAGNFLRKPSKNMSKYYFSKCQYIFLSNKFRIEKILSLYNKTKSA